MTQVFVARNPVEAHLVQGILEAAGIGAEVRGEALWSARGGLPLTADTLPAVWVLDDARAAEALRLVAEYAAAPPQAAGPFWTCWACGERVEPQFAQCWRCDARRLD
jgi:hypothetical protein